MNHQSIYSSVIRRDRQVILVGKIKGKATFIAAARHNLREIQAELGADSHITPTKSHLNVVSRGGQTSVEVLAHAEQLMHAAGIRNLRKDVVFAVEYLFSLPPETRVDVQAYFDASIEWLTSHICCPIVSAVIHLDEKAPHMHVLVLPLVNGRMQGSAVVGYKENLADLKRSHYERVAQAFDLAPPVRWTNKQKLYIAEQAYRFMRDQPDLLLKPDVRYALTQAMIKDPSAVQAALSITPPEPQKKLRTMAQIFTSKGKGAPRQDNHR